VCRSRIAALLLAAALPADAAVAVTYGDPDSFTDAGDRSNDPVKVMQTLAEHLQRLGERFLPPGTDVRIEVLDLDRAGRPHMNLPTEMRIVNGKGDMPCIDLRYTIESAGTSTPPRRERVCDPEFLRPVEPAYSPHDPLAYEKRMLEEWFKARFARASAAAPAQPRR
jgi:hypothetical protein